jgi:transposase-like protein
MRSCSQPSIGGNGDLMPYSDMFKRKMVQRLTGPNAVSARALSKQVDVPQTTLSKWMRMAGIKPPIDFNNNNDAMQMRYPVTKNSPNGWSPEEKLKTVLEAATISDDQLGEFLRRKGLHETHLQQWRIQMLDGLGKPRVKTKISAADTKRIRTLEKELRRKDKALAETAALLVLKKKVQEIWGDEDENTTGRNGK